MSPRELPKFHDRVVKILKNEARSPYKDFVLEGSHNKQADLLGYLAITKRGNICYVKVSGKAPEPTTAVKRVLGYSVSEEVSQRSTVGDWIEQRGIDLGTRIGAGLQVDKLPVAIIGFYGEANIENVVLWYVDLPVEEITSRYLYLIQKRLKLGSISPPEHSGVRAEI